MKATNSILAILFTISVACIIASAVILMTPADKPQETTDSNVSQITYVLNGGTNASENPESYTEGTAVDLNDPSREGYLFTGWYMDEDLTDEIAGISGSMTGDLTLYAGWEKSMVGIVLNYDIDGYTTCRYMFYSNTNTIDGTISYSYLGYSSEKGYMMSYDETYTVRYSNMTVRTFEESDTYWSENDDEKSWVKQTWTESMDTVDGMVECEIWIGTDSSSSETQYIGIDNGICYKIVYEKTSRDSNTYITYTLSGTDTREVDTSYEVKAYCDVGVTVTGSGVSDAYSKVTLQATVSDGTAFKGWYNENGELLSSSYRYTIDVLLSDTTVYARNTSDPDTVFDSTDVTVSPDRVLTDVVWSFTDGTEQRIESDVLDYTFSEPGMYSIIYSGTDSEGMTFYGCMEIMADGDVTKTYSWTYSGKEYTASLDILYSDFLSYRNDGISRQQGSNTHDLKFVTYEDKYIVELAQTLEDLGEGMSQNEMANFILAFTQYIEYQYDEDSMGVEEYWKYPVETLFDQNGDCEDTSILFCAIAKACGYDCCMILFSGHMAAGVALDDVSGNIFTAGDTEYGYCETTTSGYSVGDYIKQNGRIVSSYTQHERGSLFQSMTVIV